MGEAQVGGADLDQLASRAQPGQRQSRVGARGDDDVHLRGQVVEQEDHAFVDVRTLEHVVVVEHQRHVVGHGAELVDHAW